MDGHRLARGGVSTASGSRSRISIHWATLQPIGQIAVDRIVRRGLVGDRVGADAALRPSRAGSRRHCRAGRPRSARLRGSDDLERLVDAGRAPVEIAGLEPLLDPALLAFDGDAMRAGHHRGERLRAAHAAEARGQDPACP